MESIGKYRVLSVLGHGGNSSVYLAVDERIGKKWAIKVIPRRKLQKNGILLLRELDHSSLPRIVEELEDTDSFYEVTDYFEGRTLDEWAKSGITAAEAMSAAYDILDVVAYLHSRIEPVIHRDIKPGNFIMTKDGKVKLIDFDLAVAGECTGVIPMGTKGYAPPEQYRGICTRRVDVFALGKTIGILFEFVPPERFSFADRLVQKSIRQICVKATDPVPEKRFEDAGEMMSAFEKCCKTRRRVRPVLSAALALILTVILFSAGRDIFRDAFRADAEQKIRMNYANASACIEEAVALYSEQMSDTARAGYAEKANLRAQEALEYIENTVYLTDGLEADIARELKGQYYILRHGAEIVAGSTALSESERTNTYRTCISDDVEYGKFLRKYGDTEEIFRMYCDDINLCQLIGDTGSGKLFYKEALSVPGIPMEMRADLIRSETGRQMEEVE